MLKHLPKCFWEMQWKVILGSCWRTSVLIARLPPHPICPQPGDRGSQSPPLDTYSPRQVQVQVTSASVGSTPLTSNPRPKVANLDRDDQLCALCLLDTWYGCRDIDWLSSLWKCGLIFEEALYSCQYDHRQDSTAVVSLISRVRLLPQTLNNTTRKEKHSGEQEATSKMREKTNHCWTCQA